MLCLTFWCCLVIGLARANFGSPPSTETDSLLVDHDQFVFASCYSTGNRNVIDIYWTAPDGQRVNDDQESTVFSSNENGQLLLTVVQAEQADEGEYVCQEISAAGEVTVLKRFSFRIVDGSAPPWFKVPYEVIEALEGQNITLRCEALGDHPMKYTWYDPHGSIITGNSSGAMIVQRGNESVLHLQVVSNKTNGVYTCAASNQLGTNSRLIELVIIADKGIFPPFFNKSKEVIYGEEFQDLTLICDAESNPPASYRWFNEYGEELSKNNFRLNSSVTSDRNSSIIIEVRDTYGLLTFIRLMKSDRGNYSCSAENRLGLASKYFQVYVNATTVQEDSLTVSIQNVTHNSVTFELIARGSSTVTGFVGRYRLSDERDFVTFRWSVEQEYKVTELLTGAKYFFQFRILSSDVWTDPIPVALPPGQPEIIVRQASSNKLSMEFFRPTYLFYYKSIERYIIKYRTVNQVGGNTWKYSDCEVTIELPSCSGNSYEISNLASRSYYSITVQAVGPGGHSEPSEMKIYFP